MITEILMDAVASFKHATSLVTDKKINLVYGLNGTGKSTISNFLYTPTDTRFSQCKKSPDVTSPIFVYNQKFIQDNFFVANSLKGIFSLSKKNKVAEIKITEETIKLNKLEQSLQDLQNVRKQILKEFMVQKQRAENEVWKIKTKFSGGDRVMEYCLEGFRNQKEKLLNHIYSIPKPSCEPEKNIDTLRKEVEALKGDSTRLKERLTPLIFSAHDVESHHILGVSILGNTDSEISNLIDKLGNSDWVKQGLAYLPKEVNKIGAPCPFCQEDTISSEFVGKIKGYFDARYEQQMDELDNLLKRYTFELENLPEINTFTDHPFSQERRGFLSNKYHELTEHLRRNISKIKEKINNPKTPIKLEETLTNIADFNNEVNAINETINDYNDRLKNRDTALAALRSEFWILMRWQYDQTISRFESDLQTKEKKIKELDDKISKINSDLTISKEQIIAAQMQTVNVDEAVNAINASLRELGIDDFKVGKHSENLYRVIRAGDSKDAFHTLSEGEKMLISFLYFCELCKGKSSVMDTQTQRIAVIDDPISSLSHIFIFNVGQLIRSVFFKNDHISQVFVLTHSLYFFYELTDPNNERRKESQMLFRISKPSSGSIIQKMKYEEIQNDYQAYWSVVNDSTQPPALIANCMRSIVEYFFSFVRKKDLNNVFQMPELQDVKFQAFCRYINRESHSLGQNIIDMKEFDYEVFREGLKLVFDKTDYLEHFNAMSKL